MENISTFENNTSAVKNTINQMKELNTNTNTNKNGFGSSFGSNNGNNNNISKQVEKHSSLIIEYISKEVQLQLNLFKKTMKVYSTNMHERSMRVHKYGSSGITKDYHSMLPRVRDRDGGTNSGSNESNNGSSGSNEWT